MHSAGLRLASILTMNLNWSPWICDCPVNGLIPDRTVESSGFLNSTNSMKHRNVGGSVDVRSWSSGTFSTDLGVAPMGLACRQGKCKHLLDWFPYDQMSRMRVRKGTSCNTPN